MILAQSSKGGALDGLVGGTATNLLGGQGASKFLKNATQILAVLFMINCIFLSLKLRTPSSISPSTKAVDKMREQTAKEQPATQSELPLLPETEPIEPANETK